jgi:hypothetical protein
MVSASRKPVFANKTTRLKCRLVLVKVVKHDVGYFWRKLAGRHWWCRDTNCIWNSRFMDPPLKKHSKPGRRLFSFGAGESSNPSKRPPTSDTASISSRYTDYTTSPHGGSTLQLLTEQEEQHFGLSNSSNNGIFDDFGEEKPRSGSPFGGSLRNPSVTQAQVAGSRKMSSDSSSSLPFFGPDSRRRPSVAEVSSVRSGSPDSLRSQSSRARWDFLRQRVLVAGAESLTTGTAGHGQTQQHQQRQRQPSASSSTSSYSVPTPVRSPTPKLSRLARLGFRQVVDSAREAAAAAGGGHESRKFAEDIQRACWSSRFPSDPSKTFKYAESTAGSSALYLPFMSGSAVPPPSTAAYASAGMNASTLSLAAPHARKHEMRRPQSIQNFASSSSSPRPASSVNQLFQTLLQYAPVGDQPQPLSHLPHENQVHTALLAPFLTLDSGDRIDEERRMAVEAFDTVVKSWKAETQEVSLFL